MLEQLLITKYINNARMALEIDTALWTNGFKSVGTQMFAEAAKDACVEKCERIRRVMRLRYGRELSRRFCSV